MFRKSIATCYWNDPIHPGGFFIPKPSASAEACTAVHATKIQYPTPGKNVLGCHALRKFINWSMSPDIVRFRSMILDFMRHDYLALTCYIFFFPCASDLFIHQESPCRVSCCNATRTYKSDITCKVHKYWDIYKKWDYLREWLEYCLEFIAWIENYVNMKTIAS